MDDLENSVFVDGEFTMENLKDLNLSRAKMWSKWMNNMTTRSITECDDEEIFIEEMDEMYCTDDEEKEDETDVENFEVVNVKNIGNDDSGLDISVIEQNLTVSNAHNVMAVISQNLNTTGIGNEDLEFLGKTLSFFENYHREQRESGFEKILFTFDEKRLEKDAIKMFLPTQHNLSPYYGSRRSDRQFDADDDTDSDSIDTARYIRLSKNECKMRKRFVRKTAIIKSYRKIKGKREELHKKYCSLLTEQYCNTNSCHCAPVNCCTSWVGQRSFKSAIDERHISLKFENLIQPQNRFNCNNSLFSFNSFDEAYFRYSTEHFGAAKLGLHSLHCFCSHRCCAANSCESQHRCNSFYSHDYQLSHQCSDNFSSLHHGLKRDCKKFNNLGHIGKSCEKERYFFTSAVENGSLNNYGISKEAKALQFMESKKELKAENDVCCLAEETTKDSKKQSPTNTTKGNDESKQFSNEIKIIAKDETVLKRDLKPKASGYTRAENKESNSSKSKISTESKQALNKNGLQQYEGLKKRTIGNLEQNVNNDIDGKEKMGEKDIFEKKLTSLETVRTRKHTIYKKKRNAPELIIISSESESEETGENLRHKKVKNRKFQGDKKSCKDGKHQQPQIENAVCSLKFAEDEPAKADSGTNVLKQVDCKQIKHNLKNINESDCKNLLSSHLSENKTQKFIENTSLSENSTFLTNLSQVINSTAIKIDTIQNKGSASIKINTQTEKPSTSQTLKHEKPQQTLKHNVPSSTNNCTLLSSINNQQSTKKLLESKISNTTSTRIVLYAPHNSTLIPNCSLLDDKYRLTLEHLGAIIGQKYAKVFFRYYKGRRDFKLTSTVYYLPPKRGYYSGDDTSDSDIDILDMPDIGRVIEE